MPLPVSNNTLLHRLNETTASLRDSAKKADLCGVAGAIGRCHLLISELALSVGLRNLFPKIVEEVYRSQLSGTSSSAQEAREVLKVWQKEGVNGKFY